jgi:hypothetical protein
MAERGFKIGQQLEENRLTFLQAQIFCIACTTLRRGTVSREGDTSPNFLGCSAGPEYYSYLFLCKYTPDEILLIKVLLET